MLDNWAEPLAMAERIARVAHRGQADKQGMDYIRHVERVAAAVVGPQAKAVAWLHDVLEDTSFTAMDLLRTGIPVDIVAAVRLLTRVKGELYTDYLDRIRDSGNALAREVKLADVADNLHRCTGPMVSLRPKYARALARLTGVTHGLQTDQARDQDPR